MVQSVDNLVVAATFDQPVLLADIHSRSSLKSGVTRDQRRRVDRFRIPLPKAPEDQFRRFCYTLLG
jgi:hypothetical protein